MITSLLKVKSFLEMHLSKSIQDKISPVRWWIKEKRFRLWWFLEKLVKVMLCLYRNTKASVKMNSKIVHHLSKLRVKGGSDLTPHMYRLKTAHGQRLQGVSSTAACWVNNYCFNLVTEKRVNQSEDKENTLSLTHSRTGLVSLQGKLHGPSSEVF